MIFLNTKIKPNPLEDGYWVDLRENPYGGIIKYYDDNIDKWVYLEEPRFKSSAASKLTQRHLDLIENVGDTPDTLYNFQMQLDNLNETKADKSEIITDEKLSEVDQKLTKQINIVAADIKTVNASLKMTIEEGDTKNATAITEVDNALSAEIDSLRESVQKGYDDSELRNALAEKASYTYVEQRVQAITGVAPSVLDTLEELATALGNDPNFAGTVTEMIAEKTSREDVLEIINDMMPDQVMVEVDPTVPNWAKQPTKPSYTASEVGALPTSTFIPNKTTDLTNDAGFVTADTVSSMIAANKPLTTTQYAKIDKMDSYVVYDITEEDVNLPLNYATIIINVPSSLSNINIHFAETPAIGSRYRLYVHPATSVSTNFYTLKNEVFHTAKVSSITRFDITAIDLTDYTVTTEGGSIITSEGGSTIVVNILDGYIIDYVSSNNNSLTWYEGE